MVTTTSQYQVTSEPADPRELPKIVRRALRNGEFVPHGKNCCISNNQHNDVMLDTRIMKEAFVMTAPPAYSAGQVFVKEKKAQFKKPVEIYNILKD